ncbi:MAG: DNA-directed RNA polymerase subunit omega [Sedimentibacter sp.]
MKKISVDKLIDMVDSRFSLVTIISKRARQIIDGSDILIKTTTIKPVGVAIEEFYDNKYEAIYDYDKFVKEKAEKELEEKAEEKLEQANEGLEQLEEAQTKE